MNRYLPTVWSYYRSLAWWHYAPAVFGVSVAIASLWLTDPEGLMKAWLVAAGIANVLILSTYAHTYYKIVRPHQEWNLRIRITLHTSGRDLDLDDYIQEHVSNG